MDFTEMTDEELAQLQYEAGVELARRQTAAEFGKKLAAVVAEGREAGVMDTPEPGEQWQPGHVYSLGDVVSDNGERYESLHPYNVWKPGDTSNPVHWTLWKLLDEPEIGDSGYELWSGLGVDYDAGDVHEHDGKVWEALQTHTSQPDWAPGIAHSLWKLVADENGGEPEEPVEGEGDQLPAWQPDGHAYTVGDQFDHEGTPYRVLQDHVSQPHWTPDTVPALYEKGQYT